VGDFAKNGTAKYPFLGSRVRPHALSIVVLLASFATAAVLLNTVLFSCFQGVL